MKITILCVGKIKEKFYRDAVEEYEKRLSRYCKLEIIEVPDEKTPDGVGALVEEQIKAKEAERMEKHLRDGAFVCALAIDGGSLILWSCPKKWRSLVREGSAISFLSSAVRLESLIFCCRVQT